MINDRDLEDRVQFHREHFGVSRLPAIVRARRELDPANYWTVWEIRDSAHVDAYLRQYIEQSITTSS